MTLSYRQHLGRLVWGASLVVVALGLSAAPAEISWSAPSDGGTPRETNRVERLAADEYRIRAAFEEGGQSVLRHAVSRMDLLVRNSNDHPVKVTLHVDLSEDGKRIDFDNKPEAGMKLRDFLFIQPPNNDWRQINGTTERWVATVNVELPPGETKIGLSPWYTYGDYLHYVRSIPPHPHLEKRLAGTSDHGNEHWELTITDPSVPPDKKRTIYWQAREHAYETFSSFAMEGLVAFLLSDEAAEFRRHYLIVLHPMTNVDGVALGYEYRAGYDFPDPHGTATGRLTFDTVDRLRPDFAVAWHNWVAPRDRNVVFYTDGENGRATPRAWLRFTQLFPSLHGADHRWKDETTPLRYNWEGRRPLSEVNIHQYAMKKYGTRIWGWEMPWWNYSVAEVRASGAAFGRAFLTTLDEIQSGTVPSATNLPDIDVPRWEMHEFTIHAPSRVANPFRDAALVGEFVSPSGKTNVVDGFHDGGDTWRLRLAPDEPGDWNYRLRGEGVDILQVGKLRCTPSVHHGPVRVHPENPYAFAYADGSPFFPMGDTCYGLFDDTPITPALRAEYLRIRRAQHFNFVRLTVGHSEARATIDSNYWAWGGTAQKPDLDRFNPAFFHNFDALMQQLQTNGMCVELILLNFYRSPYTDTNTWTAGRERQWLRHLLARYGAFDTIFLWSIANEYETHPDGKYRLDFPGDVDWAKATARFIKTNDYHHHLVTIHPVISASRQGESPRAPFDPPWRIGEFFGVDDAMDVLSQQTGANGGGTAWDENLQCWTGDSVTLVDSLHADRRYQKPVLNTENGYEYLRGEPSGRQQVHHTDKVRRSAWRIACSGGYFSAGFQGTLGHSDVWNPIDAPKHYGFSLKSEGADEQLLILYAYFSALPYWQMQPFVEVTGDAVALAKAGQVYVIYLPHGGATTVTLTDSQRTFTAQWFNPRDGSNAPGSPVISTGKPTFTAPDTNDWTLMITQSRP